MVINQALNKVVFLFLGEENFFSFESLKFTAILAVNFIISKYIIAHPTIFCKFF